MVYYGLIKYRNPWCIKGNKRETTAIVHENCHIKLLVMTSDANAIVASEWHVRLSIYVER